MILIDPAPVVDREALKAELTEHYMRPTPWAVSRPATDADVGAVLRMREREARCDDCGSERAIASVGEPDDCESRTAKLCRSCIMKLHALIMEELR